MAFQDSVDVITLLGGGSNAAGFIQVMRGLYYRGHVAITIDEYLDLKDPWLS